MAVNLKRKKVVVLMHVMLSQSKKLRSDACFLKNTYFKIAVKENTLSRSRFVVFAQTTFYAVFAGHMEPQETYKRKLYICMRTADS